jgi:trk system potassium uptake protein TrkA
MHVDSGWVGTTIGDMQRASHCPIPFLTRFGVGQVPSESTIYQDGDLLYVAVHNDREADVEKLFDAPPAKH